MGIADAAELRRFAERYTAAWCSQDAARVAEHFAANGTLTINGGATAVGRAAISAAVREFMTAFPDLRVEMDELVVGGDFAEYRWTLSGTNTGPGGTGYPVRTSGFEVWTLEDGLIAKSAGTFDAAEYARQIEGRAGSGW
jgi:uncharacterized protein (TIGR02246 family)